eukprot:5068506-Lingulodinium_polyedra.AAC.1
MSARLKEMVACLSGRCGMHWGTGPSCTTWASLSGSPSQSSRGAHPQGPLCTPRTWLHPRLRPSSSP